MGLGRGRDAIAAAVLAAVVVGDAVPLSSTVEWGEAGRGGGGLALAVDGDGPFEQRLAAWLKETLREGRRALRQIRWVFGVGLAWWWRLVRQLEFPMAVVAGAALADAGLINSWRREGLRVFASGAVRMLYVYVRLFCSRQMKLGPKLLLVAAVAYGAAATDLVPDRGAYGRVEDIIVVAIATRVFIAACPARLVQAYAERAVGLRPGRG